MRIPRFKLVFLSLATLSLLTALFSLNLGKVSADGHPEITGGGGVINDLVDVYIPITGLEAIGDSEDPIPVTLTVPNGELSMTNTTGITFSKGPVGSRLAFTGSKTDINNALATLRFRSAQVDTFELSVSLTNPGLVYFPGNGHLYEVVNNGSGISWTSAKSAAEARSLNGAQGYLATVTSQEENDYISARLEDSGWMGASDAETEGDWKWVTGPETNTSFWLGLGDGEPVNGGFSAWAEGEPNNYNGSEHCAQYYPEGNWNDLPCNGGFLNKYVVEYGADGDLPNAPSTTSVTINTSLPSTTEIEIGSCLDLIETASTNQNGNRYNTLSLTQDIDCSGETIEPLFNDILLIDGDEDEYELLGFKGVFNGNGNTISNLSIEAEGVADYEWLTRAGLFASADGAIIQDVNFSSGSVIAIGGWSSQCTGGVVGEATNTILNNIESYLDVSGGLEEGSHSVGGLVGCLTAEEGDSTIIHSSSYGSVAGFSSIGGLAGRIESNNNGDISITNNEVDASLEYVGSGYELGGVAGEISAEDMGSLITITNNIASGFDLDGYGSGGMVGYLQLDEDAEAIFNSNEVTGDLSNNGSIGGVIGDVEIYDGSKLELTNHHVDIDVSANNDSSYAGGIIGELYLSGESEETRVLIDDTSYSGIVSAPYTAGGIAGEFCADYGDEEAIVRDVFTTGEVAVLYDEGGGLFGEACQTEIQNSGSDMIINGSENLGGLVGSSYDTLIYQSYALGDVTSEFGYSGGLVGRNTGDSEIIESFASGDVVGYERVGGLAGANGASILNSFSRGSVEGEEQVGGLVGRCGGEISKSYATGLVSGSNEVGGVLGSDQGCDIYDTFWDAETTAQAESASTAIPKSTAEMLLIDTYTNPATVGLDEAWDFEYVWAINAEANSGYPCLQWAVDFCSESDQSIDMADYNDDSIPDTFQPNIGSYISPVTGNRIVIDVGDDCELTVDDLTREVYLDVQDPEYDYNHGLFNFAGDCGEPGFTTTVKLYYYNVQPSGYIARKYNPNNNQYHTLTQASITSQTINSSDVTVLSYQITDGGELDTDMEVNGEFEDPVGLASSVLEESGKVNGDSLANTGQGTTPLLVISFMVVVSATSFITVNNRKKQV